MARKKSEAFNTAKLEPATFIHTGIFSLDVDFRGWTEGALGLITGFPGAGKTTVALATCSYAISQNIPVYYFDTEMGLSLDWIEKLRLPVDQLQIFQHLNLERCFEMLEEFTKDRCLIVVDSLAALTTEAEESYGYRAKFLSQNLPPILQQARQAKATLIFTNQMRYSFTSPGNYILPGGFALLHYASTHLELSLLRKLWSNNGLQAIEVSFHLSKVKQGQYNKLPKGSFYIHFKEGINSSMDLRRLAERLKLIEVKNNMVYLEEQSWTERGFLEWLKRDGKEVISAKIREVLYEKEIQPQEDSEED